MQNSKTFCIGIIMGRTKYSDSERTKMITIFLRAAMEIINREGMEQVSIRKVAKLAGFNSATIYLYFKDIDQLVTMASMGYLEDYCRTLTENLPDTYSPYDMYLYTWKMFCQHAFSHPQIYHRLFYHPHSNSLDETAKQYYQIFPQFLKNVSSPLYHMLRAGSLESRNLQVLQPLADNGMISSKDVVLINHLIICYFGKLLEEQCSTNPAYSLEEQTNKCLNCIRFLLQK